ncbi:MAG: PAS domain-containing protein [Syntrophobacteraceae bacterium]
MPFANSFCSMADLETECPFMTLADKLPDVIAQYDPQLRIIYVNSAIEAATGLPPREVLGKTHRDIYADAEFASRWDQVLTEAFKTGKCATPSFAYSSPRGTLHFESLIVPQIAPDGSVKSLIAYSRNITRCMRESTEAAYRHMVDIIECLPDATFVIDKEGKVIAWNRAIEEMTGIAKKEIIGKCEHAYAIPFYGKPRPILIDLAVTGAAEHIDGYDSVERKGDILRGEAYAPNLYEGRGAYLWVSASPLFDKKGNKIGAIEAIRDITHRKSLESSLLERERDLEDNARKLGEINTALKVLLNQREGDRKDHEENILANIKVRVFPYLEHLRRTRLDERQKAYVDILESYLEEVISPFLRNLSSKYYNLTPMEIRIADLIKTGRTSKEIAHVLCVAEKTVLAHRNNIRAKLNLKNEKINLRSHLASLC